MSWRTVYEKIKKEIVKKKKNGRHDSENKGMSVGDIKITYNMSRRKYISNASSKVEVLKTTVLEVLKTT